MSDRTCHNASRDSVPLGLRKNSASARVGIEKTGANKVCHPWNHPLMGSRSLNYYVQKRWYEHSGNTWTASGGVVEACNSKKTKPLCFSLSSVCKTWSHKTCCMHSTTPRLWAVPPWHGHHARFFFKQQLVQNHNGISLCAWTTKVSGHASTTQKKFSFVFVQQGRKSIFIV